MVNKIKKENHDHCEVFNCKRPAYVKIREGFTEYLCCSVHLQEKNINKLKEIKNEQPNK